MGGRPLQRRGYILVVVLGLTAVLTAMGWATMDAHSTVMPESVNRLRAARAHYLAESAVAVASHFLMYPPTSVAAGEYWTGASNIQIDNTTDFADVTVARSDTWTPPKTDLNLYRINATGVAHDPNGLVAGKRFISAEVIAPQSGMWRIPYGYLATGGATISAAVQVYGDVHSNNTLLGFGWCQSRVSASVTALWTGTGPPSAVVSLAPSVSRPTVDTSLYTNYELKGTNYSAYTGYVQNSMIQAQATTVNAINMAATNPGRIIRVPTGDFRLRQNAVLNGTLLVNGDLEIDDTGIEIRAVKDFPALIVTGDIEFTRSGATLVVVGAVLCGGIVRDNGNSNTRMTVTGTCMTRTGFNLTGLGGLYRMYWDASRSCFHDFQNQPTPQPMTYLSWTEQ